MQLAGCCHVAESAIKQFPVPDFEHGRLPVWSSTHEHAPTTKSAGRCCCTAHHDALNTLRGVPGALRARQRERLYADAASCSYLHIREQQLLSRKPLPEDRTRTSHFCSLHGQCTSTSEGRSLCSSRHDIWFAGRELHILCMCRCRQPTTAT